MEGIETDSDFVRKTAWFIASSAVVFTIKTGPTHAADTCTFQQGTTSVVAYCENSCCETECCSNSSDGSGVDTTLILIILGVIVAVVIAVLIIIAIICCLKDRKKDREMQKDIEVIELTDSPTSTDSGHDDPDRPRLHREKAMVVDKELRPPHAGGGGRGGGEPSRSKRSPRPEFIRETAFFKNEVTPCQSSVRTVSGSSRASRERPRGAADSSLPQVIEVQEDLEAEEEV